MDDPKVRDVYLEYLKEQYAAARHHQTMRVGAITFIFSASGVVLSQAVGAESDPHSLAVLGAILVVLGCLSFALNIVFHRSNRLHVEIASWTRRVLATSKEAPYFLPGVKDYDPDIIGKAVRDHIRLSEKERDEKIHDVLAKKIDHLEKKEFRDKPWKVEFNLQLVLSIIPALIVAGGVILLLLGLCQST